MNQYDLYIDHYFKDHSYNILLYPVSYQFLVTDSFPISYNFVIGIKNYQLILKYLGFEQRDALLFGRLEQFEKVKKNIDNLIDYIFVKNDKRLYEMLVLQVDNDFDKYINVELFNTSRWLNKSKESILSAINIVDKTKSAEIWHKFIETLSVVVNELILSDQKLAAPQKSNYLNLFSNIATDRNSKNAKVISNLPLFTKEKLVTTTLNVVKLIKQGKESISGKDIYVIKSNTLLDSFNNDLSLNRVGINNITTYFDFLWGERGSKDLLIIDKVYSNDFSKVIFGDLFELNNAFLVRNNELVLFSVLVAITKTIKDMTQETITVLVDRNFKNAVQEVILPGLNKNIIVKDIIQNVLLPQLNKSIKGIIQEVVLPVLQQLARSINMESDVIELNKPEKDLKFDDILFTLEERLRDIGLNDILIKLDKQIQHIVKDKIYELNTLIRDIAIFDLISVYIDKKVPLWKEGLISLIASTKNLTLFDISVYNKIKYANELIKPIYLDGKVKEIVTSVFLRPFIKQKYLKLRDLALLDKHSKEVISLVIGDLDKYNKEVISLVIRDLDKYDKESIKLVLKDFDNKIKELLLDLSFDKFKVDKQKFNLIDDKIFLLDAIYNIYVHRNNIIEVTWSQNELIYIPYPFIYTNFYRRWYFMPSDGPYDRIILPQDYPYETIPYNGVNQHPIPNGKDKALEEIDVDINIIANVIDFCHELWMANSFLYSRYTPQQALKHFVNTLFDWLDKYVPDVIEKLPEYYEDYELYPNPDTVRQDYWRIYKLIRWYAEAFILNVPHEDKNQLLGNKYVKYLIQDLIKYFNDHHGVYGPPGEKIFDKVKGIRHKWLTKERNKLV